MEKMKDIDLVNYIINQHKTAKEAAKYFEVSLSTVKKRLAAIKNSLSEQSDIYINLQEVASSNEKAGKIKGGKSTNSGAKRIFEIDKVREIAIAMLASNLTIEEAALKYEVATSTLADNLETLNCEEYKELYADLKSLYEAHKSQRNTTHLQMKYSEKVEEKKIK